MPHLKYRITNEIARAELFTRTRWVCTAWWWAEPVEGGWELTCRVRYGANREHLIVTEPYVFTNREACGWLAAISLLDMCDILSNRLKEKVYEDAF